MRAESNLERTERLISHLGAGILLVDHDRLIVQCGAVAAELLGQEPADLRGQPLDRVLADDASLSIRVVAATLMRGRALTWRPKNREGALRAQSHTDGSRAYIVVDDISERMRRAEELNTLHFALEKFRESMTDEGSLLAKAHDLRNLLTVLGLEAERFARDGAEVGSLLAMTEEAITLAHALAPPDAMRVEAKTIDAHAYLENAVASLRGCAGPECSLEVELDASDPVIPVSSSRLRSVLLNLVVNARRAGAHSIVIGTRDDEGGGVCIRGFTIPKGRYLALWVRDDASGMTPDVAEQAFDLRFTTHPEGTGVGLARVQRIAQDARGAVVLQTEPGRGTEITLYLPMPARPRGATGGSGAASSGSIA